MDNEYTVQDLISLSYDQKPIEFNNAFNSLIADRLAQAVNARKIEVAQSMFKEPVEDIEQELETEIDQEEQVDGETA